MTADDPFILKAEGLSKSFGRLRAVNNLSLNLGLGETLVIVGESGSGKSTLLSMLAGRQSIDSGSLYYQSSQGRVDLKTLSERDRRRLSRTEWGFLQQHGHETLRPHVSAGGHVSERLMVNGYRHYGKIREEVASWMQRVELDPKRMDESPAVFSGGMQQRLRLIANLISSPRLLFMDEPTTGLDVSVQARLLDLLKTLRSQLNLSMILVTHDLGVARMLADRILVMLNGSLVEAGLADQVLEDPQHAYTQQLVASSLL
ncbi:MAG: ATP-binding cassette domain-containing protein [Burkholderiaceae bacterium]|jgi:putative phosphonate transport system ATP-binding protein